METMAVLGSITHKVYARVGLLGNPSDGYFGKAISFSLANFHAQVTLQPSEVLNFLPHLEHDRFEYASLEQLRARAESQGYYGGVRLLMAACKKFQDHCTTHAINLQPKCFTLSYDTNIPRQAGLAGSSAIVCAAIHCLMQYYAVEGQIPLEQRPGLVLAAEQELGIAAGLQDRVIQMYGGLVYMDFDEQHMQQHGYGRYTPLSPRLLPPLHLMYSQQPSDSGKVHSDVKRRWHEGEPHVRELMQRVADCAEQGRTALETGDMASLARLINTNFDLRREMFGDAALGATNIRMIELARSHGCAAKFTGSGGAVVVFCPQGEAQSEGLRVACEGEGFVVVPVQLPAPRV